MTARISIFEVWLVPTKEPERLLGYLKGDICPAPITDYDDNNALVKALRSMTTLDVYIERTLSDTSYTLLQMGKRDDPNTRIWELAGVQSYRREIFSDALLVKHRLVELL